MRGTAVVTGGSRGIGRAISVKLASEGVYIVVNYLSRVQDAEETLSEIRKNGGNGHLFKGDVSDYKKAQELTEDTVKRCGRVDMLINNAGISHHGLLMDMDENQYDRVMDVNLKSAFNMTRHMMPYLLKTRGTILNISSIWSEKGASNEVVYSMTKAGINAFTKSLAREMAPSGIRVNSIAPGLIDTEMNSGLSPEEKEEMVCYLASHRMGTASDIANLAWFLLSPESQYINGQIITADGGYII